MAGPFDYTIQAPNVGDEIAKGVQFGAALFDRNQKLQLEQQQRAAQAQAAQQANDEMARFLSIPLDRVTSQDIFRVSQFMPVDRLEESRDLFAAMPKEVQQREMSVGTQAMSALLSGRPDIAAGTLRTRAEGARNSGDEQKAKGLEVMADAVEKNPDFGFKALSSHIAGLPGGKEAIESIITARKGPSEIKKAEAGADQARSDADVAAVKAKFAESQAVIDLQKAGWDIKQIQNDIDVSKQNARIAMMQAQIAREGNTLKRQELQLKIDEMAQKRDETVRAKVSEAESARSNIDNMLNTADRILKTPMSVVGAAAGPISARMPTMSQDTSDFESLIETLGSQAFLAQVPQMKGFGALSQAEGDKLQSALQSFSLKQSPERLMANVKEAQRLILKARGQISSRFGIPETVPDTPSANPSAKEVDAILRELGITP